MIREGADVEFEDEFGGFPLGWASYYGYKDIVQELINSGELSFSKKSVNLSFTKQIMAILLSENRIFLDRWIYLRDAFWNGW